MKTAIVFSGQGSQAVSMGYDFYQTFPQAKEVFEEVDETLQFPLSKLIFEGPAEKLNQTQYAQPAIMAVSMAIWRVFHPTCQFMAGHSLGEYTALCAAESLSLKDTTNLLWQRGQAFSSVQGSMLVVLGLSLDKVKEVAQQTNTFIANENSALQTTISGTQENIEKADVLARSLGSKHTVKLSVSGPFHSPLMASAQKTMDPLIKQVNMRTPAVPVISNVNAHPVTEPEEIKQKLIEQIVSPVRWQSCVQTLVNQGVEQFIEIGAGRILTGLIKRINPDVKTQAVTSIKDLDNLS